MSREKSLERRIGGAGERSVGEEEVEGMGSRE